jgi:hypothetical protein
LGSFLLHLQSLKLRQPTIIASVLFEVGVEAEGVEVGWEDAAVFAEEAGDVVTSGVEEISLDEEETMAAAEVEDLNLLLLSRVLRIILPMYEGQVQQDWARSHGNSNGNQVVLFPFPLLLFCLPPQVHEKPYQNIVTGVNSLPATTGRQLGADRHRSINGQKEIEWIQMDSSSDQALLHHL